jgi:hypothetical protein
MAYPALAAAFLHCGLNGKQTALLELQEALWETRVHATAGNRAVRVTGVH